MISILALLILFGVGGLALALVIFGVASKRLWFIPVVGLVLLFMLGASGLMLGIVAPVMQRHTTYQMSSPAPFPEQMGMTNQTLEVTPFAMSGGPPAWTMGLRWGAILGAFLLILLVRRLTSPHHPHGFWRAWPIIVVACFVGFILLTRVSVRTSYNPAQVNAQAAQQTADAIAAQQQIVKSQEQMRTAQSKLEAAARQRILQQHPNARIVSQSSTARSADPNDIHELMDKFDAPRIAVNTVSDKTAKPNIPEPPTAPTPAAAPPAVPPPAPAALASDDKPKSADNSASSPEPKPDATSKATGTASETHKKPKTKPGSDAKPPAQPSVQPKSLKESAKKEEGEKKESKPTTKTEAVAESKSSASANRPAWVDESPKRTGTTRREVISTEQYETIDECYKAADVYLLLKTYERMQQLAGQTTSDAPLPSITFDHEAVFADGKLIIFRNAYAADERRLSSLQKMGITADYLRREIVAKAPPNNESCEYIETVERTFGPMKKLYLGLEFTPAIDRQLMRYWDTRLRSERFAFVGFGAGSLLGVLACAFALLKIDTWTKGYYTKRLFIGVPAAIIGGAYLLYFVAVLH